MPLLAAVAATLALVVAAPVTAQADVDDFSYASWDVQMHVGVDADGTSTMHVVETLVASFPEFDQNRGIVRGLPMSYQGASLGTTVVSVTDGQGAHVPWESETEGGLLMLALGDDSFQHGLTTYRIEYTMHDVITSPSDADIDEFYWDLLPLDSTQAIDLFVGEVVFDATLSQHLTGSVACYQGVQGSTTQCRAMQSAASGTASFSVVAQQLRAGEGVTLAIGVARGIVTQPPARTPNLALDAGPFAAVGAAVLAMGAAIVVRRRQTTARHRATGIIVPQYDVPASWPPLVARTVIQGAKNAMPAEIVHLAVLGALRLSDQKRGVAARWGSADAVSDPVDVTARDAILSDKDPDAVVKLWKYNEARSARMRKAEAFATREARERGLLTRGRSVAGGWIGIVGIVVSAIAIVAGIVGCIDGRMVAPFAVVAGVIGLIVSIVVAIWAGAERDLPSAEGARAAEYLLGVRDYIGLAEADRIRMLQSYSGAERRTDGSVDVIHLYERLLPYAILFGMEREWGVVLQEAYASHGSGPSWYPGVHVATFASSIAKLPASATAVAPSSSSSSSSAGSFGGGFSGGGGGGGFSGGR